MLLVLVIVGCEWMSRPVDPRITQAVDLAENTKSALQDDAKSLRQTIVEAENDPTLSEKDRELLDDAKDALDQVNAKLEDLDGWIADARKVIDEAPTNGDLILTGLSIGAGALGIPFVPTILALMKRSKQFTSLVRNIDSAKIDDGQNITLDISTLKRINKAAGIEPRIEKIRG